MEQSIPSTIVDILVANGYNDPISLSGINEQEIETIEQFVNDNLHTLSEQYSCLKPFVFLPGHKKLLIGLGKKAEQFLQHTKKVMNIHPSWNQSDITFLMSELIKSAQENSKKYPTRRRYTDSIKEFSSYIYMLAGKSAYEVLCANLPLPQASTIRKYTWNK